LKYHNITFFVSRFYFFFNIISRLTHFCLVLIYIFFFNIASSTKKKVSKVTLSSSQKYEFCLYADKYKLTWTQYINWIEEKWNIRINKSIITWILKGSNKWLAIEIIHSEQKQNKSVTFSELELVLKEFVLKYQHQAILSDELLIKKAKLLVNRLEISKEALKFSFG